MEVNRLAELKRDADIFVTFEGDNIVMLQQVGKELLGTYAQRFGGRRWANSAATLAENAYAALRTRSASAHNACVVRTERTYGTIMIYRS